MEERLDQQIAVGGVPQILHLTFGAQVGQRTQYMERNRNGDLAYRIRLLTVLYVRRDVFR